MQLIVLRHAIAETLAAGGEDGARRLTARGRARMQRGARGLRRELPELGRIVSSPLPRAVETAEILAGLYPGLEVETLDLLAPGGGDVRAWLGEVQAGAPLVLVGHQPDLGLLVAALTGAEVVLKKGGAARIDLARGAANGGGVLRWLLTPSQLRDLAD